MTIVQDVLNSVVTSGLKLFAQSRQPQKSGRISMEGISGKVNIYRDTWGVPHIYAENMKDLMFAQGFVHAQDRFWQMEFNRRLVAGRLSEVLGKETLQIDRWMRILGLRRVANQEIPLLDGDTLDHFSAYSSGVNAFIAQNHLPVEFALLQCEPEPWCVEDSLSWIKMMSWNLSSNWETELLRANLIKRLGTELAAELEPEDYSGWPYILPLDFSRLGHSALEKADSSRLYLGPAADEGIGSNNWVVSGSRTETGKPLLANDMHLHMSIPAIWYENHLAAGDFEVTGITFPGLPGVVSGHNRNIAWGFTNGFPDVQDLYMERLKKTEDGRVMYQFKEEWLEALVIKEPILVKNGESEIEEVIITRHGPIINLLAPDFAGEQPLALKWTSHEPDSMGNTIFKLNQAKNYPEFLEALRFWTAPVQNVVYADVEGNIAYYFPGKVPIREKGDGRVPAPGWTGEYEWSGYIPFEELPHIFNPTEGYIATANNRVVDPSYPHFISRDFVTGDRAKRIMELIEGCEKITLDYIQKMHFDLVSPSARAIANCICQLSEGDDRLEGVIEKMRTWDGKLSPQSSEAAVYEVFIRKAVQLILKSKLGDFTETYMGKGPTPFLAENSLLGNRALEWLQKVLLQPESHWFESLSRDETIKLALLQTINYLEETCGATPDKWAWGKLHSLCFTHHLGRVEMLKGLFNRGTYPLGGDFNTVWATGAAHHDVSCERVVGPPFRFICDLSDIENSYGLLCPGQSGCPVDEHYDDQISAWFERGYHPMLFTRKSVEENSKQHLILSPE
jgi:penicillin G amidase